MAHERDWTPTDQACAEDDRRDREWWRRDSALSPWMEEPVTDGCCAIGEACECMALSVPGRRDCCNWTY